MKKTVYIISIGLCLAIGIALFYRSGPNPLGAQLGITNTPAVESPTPLPTDEIAATATQAPSPSPTPVPTQTAVPTQPVIQPTATATQPPSAPKKTTEPVLPQTGMAINDPSISSNNLKAVMELVIPAINLDKSVYPVIMSNNTWDLSTLGNRVAWLLESSAPPNGGNTVMVGHLDLKNDADGAFRNLAVLQKGDVIYVLSPGALYTYIVTDKKKVTPDDSQILANTNQAQLTLLTCSWDSWDFAAHTYTSRLVVVARLQSSQIRK